MLADTHGSTMSISVDFKEVISWLATARVRMLLSELMQDPDYQAKVQEGNLSFLRSDRAFEKCMEIAYKKWHWVHKRLG